MSWVWWLRPVNPAQGRRIASRQTWATGWDCAPVFNNSNRSSVWYHGSPQTCHPPSYSQPHTKIQITSGKLCVPVALYTLCCCSVLIASTSINYMGSPGHSLGLSNRSYPHCSVAIVGRCSVMLFELMSEMHSSYKRPLSQFIPDQHTWACLCNQSTQRWNSR